MDSDLGESVRAYVCLSIAKYFWSYAGIQLFLCDGIFTHSWGLNLIVLIAANEVKILALAIVGVENADNWLWFNECLDDNFPGYNVWILVANKGIRSNALAIGMSQNNTIEKSFQLSHYARHWAENCKEVCKGTMNEDHKSAIIQLAKSRAASSCWYWSIE